MKVHKINTCYAQKSKNLVSKDLSFRGINLSAGYKRNLYDNASDTVIKGVAELTKKKINLKELLNYKGLSFTNRLLFDKYLAYMPQKEIGDLTVDVSDGTETEYKHDINVGLGGHCVHLWDRIKPIVKMSVKLPTVGYDGELVYKERKLEFSEEINSGMYDGQCHYTSAIGARKEKERADANLERQRPELQKKMEDEIGFTFPLGGYFPIPTDKIYNVIARVIMEDLDKLAEYEKADAENKREEASKAERKKRLDSLFD